VLDRAGTPSQTFLHAQIPLKAEISKIFLNILGYVAYKGVFIKKTECVP